MTRRVAIAFVLAWATGRAAEYPPPPLTAVRPVIDRIQQVEFVDLFKK